MALREKKKQEVRTRILDACEAWFREVGFDETPVDEIARAADVSRQTFFNYFPSKDAALTALGIRWLFSNAALVRAQGLVEDEKRSVLDVLLAGLRRQLDHIERDRAFARLVFTRSGALLPSGPAVGTAADAPRLERTRTLFEMNSAMIRLAQERGELRTDAAPEQIAEIWVGTVLFTLRLGLIDYWGTGVDLTARVMRASELLLEGLRTTPTRGPRPRNAKSTRRKRRA